MTRLLTIAVAVALALAATACRAPGEPPSHPSDATYRDLIRREVATAGSALGSAELLLAQARAGKITMTYAEVGLRQTADDLDGVATDLAQVTPPVGRVIAQQRLRAIVANDRVLLRAIADHWAGTQALARAQARAATDQERISGPLSITLGA
jgi:hypothetical protein